MTTAPANNRIELLYGTLDLLILRTLLYGPSHGHAIAKHIQRVSENALQIETGSLYPPCTSWRGAAGSRRSGRSRTRASAPATTASPRPAASTSRRSSRAGRRCRWRWRGCCSRQSRSRGRRSLRRRTVQTPGRVGWAPSGAEGDDWRARTASGPLEGRSGRDDAAPGPGEDTAMWQVYTRLRSLWRWQRQETELDEEIRVHLAMEMEERLAAGMSPEDARAAAQRDFGNVPLIRELTRESWGRGPAERLLQDVRSAIRGLRRNPGYTCAVVLTLALGIGLNAAMYGMLSRLFLQAPPTNRVGHFYVPLEQAAADPQTAEAVRGNRSLNRPHPGQSRPHGGPRARRPRRALSRPAGQPRADPARRPRGKDALVDDRHRPARFRRSAGPAARRPRPLRGHRLRRAPARAGVRHPARPRRPGVGPPAPRARAGPLAGRYRRRRRRADRPLGRRLRRAAALRGPQPPRPP